MHNDNWDDLRFVLAVAEARSVSGAARKLGVNHATVLRRVAAFEARSGIALFDKSARGYEIASDRLGVINAAREVETAMAAVGRAMHSTRAPLSGEVRITSTDSVCQTILPEILVEIIAEAPDLRFTIQSTNFHVDLARTQADITIRPTDKLPDDLIGEKAAEMAMCGYRSRQRPDLTHWLGLAGPLQRAMPGRWLAANVHESLITGGADSFPVLREMAAAGCGIALLPVVLGDADARLERLANGAAPLLVPLWVASHIDLADVPRLVQVRARLSKAIARRADILLGTGQDKAGLAPTRRSETQAELQ